ncbi:MAG: 1-(5-phosphoribosyl)-5-[(5-phosphoribosylamino)methylideneamino]imidazole-4-carboxamide isomerase [Bacteroidales bacterium]|nr:1-(5-phosphoribosyl)-5-[(5-phosphoribosylamino)methylideneamino]imidazole-4-carboxamide isomerase [Bacteroidales bacterium]
MKMRDKQKNIKFEVIPAIDIYEGKCVRLTKGCYDTVKEYSLDPVEVAKAFKKAGYNRLHIVDLEGAKASFPVNLNVLERIASEVDVVIQFGGGIKSLESAKKCFDAGATEVICGSIATESFQTLESIVKEFGSDRVIVGTDVREEKVSVKGWKEQTDKTVYDVIGSVTKLDISKIICTDISKDGLLEGPALKLYTKIRAMFPQIYLIASGGISSIDDISGVIETGSNGVIVGKAFYENRINAEELIKWLQKG